MLVLRADDRGVGERLVGMRREELLPFREGVLRLDVVQRRDALAADRVGLADGDDACAPVDQVSCDQSAAQKRSHAVDRTDELRVLDGVRGVGVAAVAGADEHGGDVALALLRPQEEPPVSPSAHGAQTNSPSARASEQLRKRTRWRLTEPAGALSANPPSGIRRAPSSCARRSSLLLVSISRDRAL